MNEITDFGNNPMLRELLVEYCSMHYEENAILDDHHLLMEFNLLKTDNKLELLFETERLTNSFNK